MKKSRKDFITFLCTQYNIEILYAFGSRAKQVRKFVLEENFELSFSVSDVDIGIKPRDKKLLSIKEKVKLTIDLEDFFNVKKVDLVSIPEVDPFLASNIIRGERLFCQDNYRADEYELYILRKAGDCIPLERERIAIIMGEKQ